MRKILLGLPAFCLLMACGSSEQSAVITVSDETLMHEVRATPSPANGACVKMNPPRFMWPDKFPHLGPVLDGVPGQVDEKPKVVYRIRISQDKNFQKEVLIGERAWAFSILSSARLRENGTGNMLTSLLEVKKNGHRFINSI